MEHVAAWFLLTVEAFLYSFGVASTRFIFLGPTPNKEVTIFVGLVLLAAAAWLTFARLRLLRLHLWDPETGRPLWSKGLLAGVFIVPGFVVVEFLFGDVHANTWWFWGVPTGILVAVSVGFVDLWGRRGEGSE